MCCTFNTLCRQLEDALTMIERKKSFNEGPYTLWLFSYTLHVHPCSRCRYGDQDQPSSAFGRVESRPASPETLCCAALPGFWNLCANKPRAAGAGRCDRGKRILLLTFSERCLVHRRRPVATSSTLVTLLCLAGTTPFVELLLQNPRR